jgi:hypothetical protein
MKSEIWISHRISQLIGKSFKYINRIHMNSNRGKFAKMLQKDLVIFVIHSYYQYWYQLMCSSSALKDNPMKISSFKRIHYIVFKTLNWYDLEKRDLLLIVKDWHKKYSNKTLEFIWRQCVSCDWSDI